jgi:hypothetical protein
MKRLVTIGYRNMLILDESIPGWHQKQYPTAVTAVRQR